MHVASAHTRHGRDPLQGRGARIKSGLCVGILGALQIGIEKKIIGMELIHGAALMTSLGRLRCGDRGPIGIDIRLPHAQRCV